MTSGTSKDLRIRTYRDEDEPAVLDLLSASLGAGPGGDRSPEFFRWKHLENVFGRSFMMVAETGERVIGFRSFMRWTFTCRGQRIRGMRAVDTATHPDMQGRGVFSRLTLAALEALPDEADLVFNTPNEKSLPGYLKMGWKPAGRVPILVSVRRPLRFVRGARTLRNAAGPARSIAVGDAPSAAAAIDGISGLGELLRDVDDAERADPRLRTARSVEYFRWRFATAPLLDYRATWTEDSGGMVTGLAFFRVRPRGSLVEATISEVLAPPEATAVVRRLLRSVRSMVSADHLTCHAAKGSALSRIAKRVGFFPVPGGMTFVVNPLRPIDPDPSDLASWSLALGDLEVF